MNQKIIEEIAKAVTEELRNKERVSVTLEIGGKKVKGIGITTGLLTPFETAVRSGLGGHPDPFYRSWAKVLAEYVAKNLCGPAIPGTSLAKDRAPLCDFDDIPTEDCEHRCGPILVLRTDTEEIPAPPCHGADKPACAGKVYFKDLCTMIKAGGCRSRDRNDHAFYYAVSLLDFSNRSYTVYDVKLMVDDMPLALYSFYTYFTPPEHKGSDEILYLYMSIRFPYDYEDDLNWPESPL